MLPDDLVPRDLIAREAALDERVHVDGRDGGRVRGHWPSRR
jgi:hypothetical protein